MWKFRFRHIFILKISLLTYNFWRDVKLSVFGRFLSYWLYCIINKIGEVSLNYKIPHIFLFKYICICVLNILESLNNNFTTKYQKYIFVNARSIRPLQQTVLRKKKGEKPKNPCHVYFNPEVLEMKND